MKNVILVALCAVLFTALGTPAAYASGSSPKGKPFVAINDQIVAVSNAVSSIQDQIDSLTVKVDTMEERLTADEDAITTVSNQNLSLQTLIDNNLTTLTDIQAQIASLQQTNTDLQAAIAANSGDIVSEQQQVDDNNALISSLQNSILMVQDGVISLSTSLQGQVDANTQLIAAIQAQIDIINDNLAVKQDLINGTCPDGSAVKQVNPDGSVVCGAAGGGGVSGQLEAVFVWTNDSVENGKNATRPGGKATVQTNCPAGYTITGVGMNTASGWNVNAAYTVIRPTDGKNFSIVQGINNNPYYAKLTGVATCSRIAP